MSSEHTWNIKGAITWQGHYQGYDANSGLFDAPLNYIRVSYRLSVAENGCLLGIVSDTFGEQTSERSQQCMEYVGQGWQLVGDALVAYCRVLAGLLVEIATPMSA